MNALALFLPVVTRRDIAFTLVLPERAAERRPARRRLCCRWRKDPRTERLVCAWSGEDAVAAADARKGGLRRAA
jgi:hypothetical protein